MRRCLLILLASVLAVALTAEPVAASPVLLHEINVTSSGSTSNHNPPPAGTDGFVYVWAYGFESLEGGSLFRGIDAELVIGSPAFFDGDSGTVDFDSSNTPDFTAFATLFTDGVDKILTEWQLLYLLPNTRMGSGTTGYFTFLTDALAGADLHHLRLVVGSVSIALGDNDPMTNGFPVSYAQEARWQFWGTPASQVPEPASVILLAGSLVAIVRRAARSRV